MDKAYVGRKNASGIKKYGVEKCDTKIKGSYFSFEKTIEASKNLPLFYALTQTHSISTNQLQKLYKDFGLKDSAQLNNRQANTKQLAFELAFGIAEATPEKVHQIIHTLTGLLYNLPIQSAPHIVDKIKLSNGKIVRFYPKNTLKIAAYVKNKETKETLKQIFRAPVYGSKGTLRSFQRIKGVQFLLAKSGTTGLQNNQVRDKWAVGSFKIRNHIYSYSILVGSDDINGLGFKIKHSTVIYPIMKQIVKHLQ